MKASTVYTKPVYIFLDFDGVLHADRPTVLAWPYNPAKAPSLTNQEMSDIVHFLCTLTDGFDPTNPSAYNVPAQCGSTAASVGAARIQTVAASGATQAKTSTTK